MKRHFKYLLILGIAISTFSCIPRKQMLYMQDFSNNKDYENKFDSINSITERYTLQANDYITVRVYSIDPKISDFFNGTTSNSMQSSSSSSNGKDPSSYLIDDNMNIDFPFAGYINLAGCNITRAKQKIKKALEPYLKDAELKVYLSNTTFTALGEVKSPGLIQMPKDQITIFEAIGLISDMTPYAMRKRMILLRETPEGTKTYEIDIRDKNIVNSDFYYIYPNDMLYLRPMRVKVFGFGETYSIGILTALIGVYLTIEALKD